MTLFQWICYGAALTAAVQGAHAGNLPATHSFTANARLVLVPFTVTDLHGQPVQGLQKADFTVLDDRTPQPIVSFASEDAPCSVGVVLDISGSMRNSIGTAQLAARTFLRRANSDDAFLIRTVSTRPQSLSDFTNDIEALDRNVLGVAPGGMTSLIDTIALTLSSMHAAPQPRKAVLILSDGMDNYSRFSRHTLIRQAQEAGAPVYAIRIAGLPETPPGGILRPALIAKPGDSATQRRDRALLEDLAQATGGICYTVQNDIEAKLAAQRIARVLRDQYYVGYISPDTGSGKWHVVRLRSRLPHVTIRWRSGYFAR